jgi:hypothetical protein
MAATPHSFSILQQEEHTAVASPRLLDQPAGLGSRWVVVRRLWSLDAGQVEGNKFGGIYGGIVETQTGKYLICSLC